MQRRGRGESEAADILRRDRKVSASQSGYSRIRREEMHAIYLDMLCKRALVRIEMFRLYTIYYT